MDVPQLWAQVHKLYKKGHRWWLDETLDAEIIKIQKAANSKVTDEGIVGDIIIDFKRKLERMPECDGHQRVSATMLWEKLSDGKRPTKAERADFYNALEAMTRDPKYNKYIPKVTKKHGVTVPDSLIF